MNEIMVALSWKKEGEDIVSVKCLVNKRVLELRWQHQIEKSLYHITIKDISGCLWQRDAKKVNYLKPSSIDKTKYNQFSILTGRKAFLFTTNTILV